MRVPNRFPFFPKASMMIFLIKLPARNRGARDFESVPRIPQENIQERFSSRFYVFGFSPSSPKIMKVFNAKRIAKRAPDSSNSRRYPRILKFSRFVDTFGNPETFPRTSAFEAFAVDESFAKWRSFSSFWNELEREQQAR